MKGGPSRQEIEAQGTEAVRYAAADLKNEMQIGEKPIANPGAWLNPKLLKAEERGIQLRRHQGDRAQRRRPTGERG